MNTLTLIHKNGIVNHHKIEDERGHIIQLIWNGRLRYKIVDLNPSEEDEDESYDEINSPECDDCISDILTALKNGAS